MEQFGFAALQEQVCREVTSAGRDADQLLSAVRRMIDHAEQQLAESKDVDFSLIDCRAGCKSCCVVNVSVLFPEALAIVDYLQSLPESEKTQITERLDELWRAVRGLTDDERVSLHQSCAFLDEAGSCRIYPVRPLLCRSVTSTSAENCRESLTEQMFDEQSPVLMNMFQKELYEAVYLGVGEGLEKSGREGRGVKLTGLVRYLLKKPEAGVEFLTGKKFDWHEMA